MGARGLSGRLGAAVLVTATLVSTVGTVGTATAQAAPRASVTAARPAASSVQSTAAAQPPVLPTAARTTGRLRGGQAVSGLAGAPLPQASVRQAQAALAAAPALSRTDFTPITPLRLLDTRFAIGAPRARVPAGRTITLQLAGLSPIPRTGVAGVALALTAIGSATPGYLSVYPAGGPRPATVSVNYATGQVISNLVVAKLSAGGQVTIYTSATTDMIADVHGWYATTSTLHPLTPARLLDTRSGVGAPAGTLATNRSVDVQVSGRGGVPATGATGVVLNLTGIGSPTAGSMTVYPTGTTAPGATLNLPAKAAVSNLAFVRLGTGGKVTVLNRAGAAHAVLDVVAWQGAGGQYHPVGAERRYDTRATGATGPIASGGWLDLWMTGFGSVPSVGVHAVVLNVTVVNPAANGSVVVHQQGGVKPKALSLTYTKGRTSTSQVVAFIGAGGWIRFDNSGASVNFVVDVIGWYSADGALGLTVGTPLVAGVNGAGQAAPLQVLGMSVSGSADGRYTAFIATTEVSPNAGANGISVRDNLLGLTTLVVNGFWGPRGSLSGDGHVLVFTTARPELWPGDTNARVDAFWYDLRTNDLELVSRNATGAVGNLGGQLVGPSGNGRYVVFQSTSANIAAGQGAAGRNVFVRDMTTGTAVFVGQNDGTCLCTSPQPVSDDGRFVAYESDLGHRVWDRTTRTDQRLAEADISLGLTPVISTDGRYVVFPTRDPLVASDANAVDDIYARDGTTGQVALVSHTAAGAAGNRESKGASVAPDGTVVFTSTATDLLAAGTPGLFRGTAAGGPVVQLSSSATSSAFPGPTDGTAVSFESGFVGTATRAMVVRLR